MKKFIVLSCSVVMFAAACASNSMTSRIPFPAEEYSSLPATGSGVIRGQVCLMAPGGDVVVAKGNKILLNPVTSYSRQWYEVARLKHPLGDPDPRIRSYVREVSADASGRFEFRDVPAGEYFLTTPLAWEAPWPVRRNNNVMPQGAFIVQKVAVQEGGIVEVPLICHIRLSDDAFSIIQSGSDKSPSWAASGF